MSEETPHEDSDGFGIDELKDLFLLDRANIPMMMLMVDQQPEAERKMKMEHIKTALKELNIPIPSQAAVEAFVRLSNN